MIDLYHDRARGLLVYRTNEPDRVVHYLPEARRVNGSCVAVPATLRNCQILRLLEYPIIPVMEAAGYDWPIQKGYKPLAHQKLMANFMVTHPRCFNLSDMGCVAGETLIDTPWGPKRIDVLATQHNAVVRCLTEDGPRYVEIKPPFCKGRTGLYRVTFRSGRSIVVTKRHVFLTCRGWTSCEHLQTGELLPRFDVFPQVSNWERGHVKSLPNDQHLSQIVSNSRGYFDTLFYDAPPLSAANICEAPSPSLSGVLIRSRTEWRTDVLGTKHTRTVPLGDDPLSNFRCGVHLDQGEMGVFLSEYAAKQTCNSFHISARYHLSPNRLPEVPVSQELRLCIPLEQASAPPFDTVAHIAYERTDVYYDMEVPEHANYIAHGLCNHNTMKTLATLWAADFVMSQYPKGECRALIVAPLSILQRVWGDAIFANFLGRRTFAIAHGSAEQRSDELRSDRDFYIINFDGVGVGAKTRKQFKLDGLSQEIANRADIRLTLIDEASAYRDSTTKRHRIARLVLGQRDYLWLLTGTPIPNGPTDAFGLAKLVNNAKGESWSSFHNRTMMRLSQFKWIPRAGANDEARKLLQPAIRFDIRDVWDGPPMTTQQREVALTDEQKRQMAALKRDLQIVVASGHKIDAMNEAAARQKFIQISLGAVYDGDHKAHKIDAAPRLAELRAVIKEAPGKILCFVGLTSLCNLLYKELKEEIGCEVINGATSQRDRESAFGRFQQHNPEQRDSLRMLIADPGTMAHGLNLYEAQTVIWYGPTDRTELYLQANKRAHRPGQTHPVTVVQIVSNKLEREIYRRLESNESLQGLLLQMVREGKI